MKKLEHRRLAEGEATGHYHEATSDTAVLMGDDAGNPEELVAPDGTDVTHQEHGTVTLPPGRYTTSRVQEWSEVGARDVAD